MKRLKLTLLTLILVSTHFLMTFSVLATDKPDRYNGDFYYRSEPDNAIESKSLTLHPAPRTQEQVRDDLNFVLQAFYYENGANKRMDLFQMDDYKLQQKIANLTLQAYRDAISWDFPEGYQVTFLAESYSANKIVEDLLKLTMKSLQFANAYEIVSLDIQGDTVTAQVLVRSIDEDHYNRELQSLDNFESEIRPFINDLSLSLSTKTKKNRFDRWLLGSLMKTYAIKHSKQQVRVAYLDGYEPSRPLTLVFHYDASGRITLTDDTLLAITQVKTSDWRRLMKKEGYQEAPISDQSDASELAPNESHNVN